MPPAPRSATLWRLGGLYRKTRALDRADAYRLLQWLPMPIADMVDDWFEGELLRAAVAARGLLGTVARPARRRQHAGLADPAGAPAVGTAVGGAGARRPRRAHPRDGACRAGGRRRDPPRPGGGAHRGRGRARGGRRRRRPADRGRLRGLGRRSEDHVPDRSSAPRSCRPSSRRRSGTTVRTVRMAKLNLALSALPAFAGVSARVAPLRTHPHRPDARLPGARERRHQVRRVVARAVDGDVDPVGARRTRWRPPARTWRRSTSTRCRASSRASSWPAERDRLLAACVKLLDGYAPGFSSLVVAAELLTPEDIEQRQGTWGGHGFHGDLALDQWFAMRPAYGWARYETPVRGPLPVRRGHASRRVSDGDLRTPGGRASVARMRSTGSGSARKSPGAWSPEPPLNNLLTTRTRLPTSY